MRERTVGTAAFLLAWGLAFAIGFWRVVGYVVWYVWHFLSKFW